MRFEVLFMAAPSSRHSTELLHFVAPGPPLKHDKQLPLHEGVTLDWGSAGAADQTAAAWRAASRKSANKSPTTAVAAASVADLLHRRDDPGVMSDGRYFTNGGRGGVGERHPTADTRGVTGEEAMAQALIAGRAEQAFLEDRLRASERRVEQLRGETLRLRAVLERWHEDFVAPAQQKMKVRVWS